MNILISYDKLGNVIFSYKTSETLDAFKSSLIQREGVLYLDVVSPVEDLSNIYVDIKTTPHGIKQKSEFDISISKTTLLSDGVDEAVISNIPNGTFVTWPDGQVDEVTDGVVEFSTTQPDTYVLKFEHPHNLSKEVSLEAHV